MLLYHGAVFQARAALFWDGMWYNPDMSGSFFGNIISIVYLGAFLASGYFIASNVFLREGQLLRLTLGTATGLLMLMWLPALFSFVLGFTLLSQLLALAVALGLGMLALFRGIRLLMLPREPELKPYLWCVLPVMLVLCVLLYTHVIPQNQYGGLSSGQSTYGDMCMHLSIISSISCQGFFPPEYSILPGQPMSYPFLCDSVSSTFYTLGASLRFAYMLPMIPAFFSVVSGVYLFFEDWFRCRKKAVLAFVLFFLGGGFGFAYFMNGLAENPYNLTRIFTAFYETPTNLVSENIRWVNVIADMLIPQRATLFGWSVLFPCLLLLRRAALDGEDWLFIPLGAMAGLLPLVHTHSFLALGLVSIPWFIRALYKRQGIKRFIIYGVTAMLLAAPQLLLFTFKSAGSFLTLNFNWSNDTDTFLWFYIKNLGLIFLLLPIALISAEKKDRLTWAGVSILWILCEFIQFQPNPYDNNKLLFIWFEFSCGLVASLLIDLYAKLEGIKGRHLLAFITVTVMTLSGLLTIGRELVSEYEVFAEGEVEAAEFIEENTPADALFLTTTNHNNAVASLTGRSIVCGSSSFLYYHGYDTYQTEQDIRTMYEDPQGAEELYGQYGVDYVYIGPYERNTYRLSHIDFAHLELVFANDTAAIYKYQ